MPDRRSVFRRVIQGAGIAVLSIFLGAWLSYPILLPVEQLIVAATEDVLRLHTPDMIRFYLKRLRLIDPQYRTDNGLTLLQFTLHGFRRGGDAEVNRRCLEIADFLIARGVPIDALDSEHGLSALHQAILNGEPRVVEFLLERGASPNVTVAAREGKLAGKTPLEIASLQLEQGRLTAAEVASLGEKLRAAQGK